VATKMSPVRPPTRGGAGRKGRDRRRCSTPLPPSSLQPARAAVYLYDVARATEEGGAVLRRTTGKGGAARSQLEREPAAGMGLWVGVAADRGRGAVTVRADKGRVRHGYE
jgi:hypothetical protein